MYINFSLLLLIIAMGCFENIGRAQGTLVGLKLILVGLGPYQAYRKRRP